MVCSNRMQFSCENLCGNLLPCSNHYCTKTCHALKSQSSTSVQQAGSEPCEECNLPCEKVLKRPCFHETGYFLCDLFTYTCCLSKTLGWLSFPCPISLYLFYTNWDECPYSGEDACMFTSLSPNLSSWRLPPMQGSCKAIVSLWFNGPCFWVHILQQSVGEGANDCSFMWWALPQVVLIYVLLFLCG